MLRSRQTTKYLEHPLTSTATCGSFSPRWTGYGRFSESIYGESVNSYGAQALRRRIYVRIVLGMRSKIVLNSSSAKELS